MTQKEGLGFRACPTNCFTNSPDFAGSYEPSEKLKELALELQVKPGFYDLLGYDPSDPYSYAWGVYEPGIGYHYDLI